MLMANDLVQACPRCADYLGIVLREAARNTPFQAVNGHRLKCDYRLAWIVIRGGALPMSDEKRVLSAS